MWDVGLIDTEWPVLEQIEIVQNRQTRLKVLCPSSPPAMLTAGIQLKGVCRIHIVSVIGHGRNSSSREGYVLSYGVVSSVERSWVRQTWLAFNCTGYMIAMPLVDRLGHFVSVSLCNFGIDT